MGRKNKKLFIAVIVLFMIVTSGLCFAPEEFLINGRHMYRKVNYPGFRVGERLKYNVTWNKVVSVGYGELHVKEIINVKKRDIYHVIFKVRTSMFFDIFFKIRDVFEGYIDKAGCFSWGFKMDINEGEKHYTRETLFDQKNNYGLHNSSYRKGVRKASILPYMQDFVSAMYYARRFNMEQQKHVVFNMDNDGKAYETTIKFVKRERISTKIGRVDAVKLDISWYKRGGNKRVKESHFFWLSADEDRLPLKIESVGGIGKFITSLVKVYDRGKR